MFRMFLRFAAILMMAFSMALSAQAFTNDNVTQQEHVMNGTIDNMMRYKVMNDRFLGKQVKGQSGILGGNIYASARYEDENGGICTVTVEKELGFLGASGAFKVSKRCKMEGKKGGTV